MIELSKQLVCGLCAFAIGFAAVNLLAACGTSAIEAQREAAVAVSHVSNDLALPALEQAYRSDGMLAVAGAKNSADASAAILDWRARWKPVWSAWDAFSVADAAWIKALDSGAPALEKAAAARDAFCAVRKAALEAGAHLPQFPAGACP